MDPYLINIAKEKSHAGAHYLLLDRDDSSEMAVIRIDELSNQVTTISGSTYASPCRSRRAWASVARWRTRSAARALFAYLTAPMEIYHDLQD